MDARRGHGFFEDAERRDVKEGEGSLPVGSGELPRDGVERNMATRLPAA
jgi:hypothetical protein